MCKKMPNGDKEMKSQTGGSLTRNGAVLSVEMQ